MNVRLTEKIIRERTNEQSFTSARRPVLQKATANL